MNYSVPLKYFFMMSILLLATGLWMFILHTSLSIEGVQSYYATKSFFGLLETVSPHLFGMGLFVFVLTHFFTLIENVDAEAYKSRMVLFFTMMFVSNGIGFFITEISVFFSVLKLLSSLLFIAYSLWSIYKVYKLI